MTSAVSNPPFGTGFEKNEMKVVSQRSRGLVANGGGSSENIQLLTDPMIRPFAAGYE